MLEQWVTEVESVGVYPGEDPQLYLSRVDDVVYMLEAPGEHRSEAEVNRKKIVRHLSGDVDIEQRTAFLREDLTRATINKVLRE